VTEVKKKNQESQRKRSADEGKAASEGGKTKKEERGTPVRGGTWWVAAWLGEGGEGGKERRTVERVEWKEGGWAQYRKKDGPETKKVGTRSRPGEKARVPGKKRQKAREPLAPTENACNLGTSPERKGMKEKSTPPAVKSPQETKLWILGVAGWHGTGKERMGGRDRRRTSEQGKRGIGKRTLPSKQARIPEPSLLGGGGFGKKNGVRACRRGSIKNKRNELKLRKHRNVFQGTERTSGT